MGLFLRKWLAEILAETMLKNKIKLEKLVNWRLHERMRGLWNKELKIV